MKTVDHYKNRLKEIQRKKYKYKAQKTNAIKVIKNCIKKAQKSTKTTCKQKGCISQIPKITTMEIYKNFYYNK